MNEEYRNKVDELLEKYRTNSLTAQERVTLMVYAALDIGVSSAIEEHDSLVKAIKSIKPLWRRVLDSFTTFAGLSLLAWAIITVFVLAIDDSTGSSISSNRQETYQPPNSAFDDDVFERANEFQSRMEEMQRINDLIEKTERFEDLAEQSRTISETFRNLPSETDFSDLIRVGDSRRRIDSLVLNSLNSLLDITRATSNSLNLESLLKLRDAIEERGQRSIYQKQFLEIIDLIIEEEFSKASDVIARMPEPESPETQREIDELETIIQSLME